MNDSGAPTELPRPAQSATISRALGTALTEFFGRAVGVVCLERRPSWHRTSFSLEELDATLDDGTRLHVLLKDLNWWSMPECVRRVKPRFLYDALREIETYRVILGPNRIDAPICYGASIDPSADRYWLFLERAAETELHNLGEFSAWLQVARWAARMHDALGDVAAAEGLSASARLLRYDGDFFRLWMQRAREILARSGDPRLRRGGSLDWLAARHECAVERLLSLPRTVLHGEFYASNILVGEGPSGLRVRPVDWEMAAVGPGLLDVAALAAGDWSDREKAELALAYRLALVPDDGWPPAEGAFLEAFRCARLHVAVQWLGWAPSWEPPADFAQDWLGEALRMAEELGD